MADADACTLRDRAGPLFDVDSLELRKCHSLEVNTALNEFEQKHPGLAHRFESWPPDVQQRINAIVAKWMAARGSASIRLTSSGLHQGVAVVILHYAEKK